MAEFIGLGASIVAFISLTGQLVQRFEYILGVLKGVKEANDDVQRLQDQASSFRVTTDNFRSILQDLESYMIGVGFYFLL